LSSGKATIDGNLFSFRLMMVAVFLRHDGYPLLSKLLIAGRQTLEGCRDECRSELAE
jgi:hypothetical protein